MSECFRTTVTLRCLLALSLLLNVASECFAAKPNVLLIITDDQGYGDVGFHGNTMLQTPNLDKLAKQSLRLTNFHVDPTCAETRAALMSGLFPLRVGVWHTIMGRSIMNADVVTMPQYFKAAGYRTGMFGKWHLGDNYPYRPQDRGFDVTLNHGGGGVGQTPDVWGNDYFDDVYLANGKQTPVRGYCTDVFCKAAMDFIAQDSISQAVDQPFFCYLATNAPHGPYHVDEAYKKVYLDKGAAEPMASFYGMIANIDENVGKLLQTIDDRQLADNTIVIFMTDNGTAAGHAPKNNPWPGYNAGMRGTKGQEYDGGHRVPCFIRLPGGKHANQEFKSLTAHVDLLPTLAALCDLDASKAQRDDSKSRDGQQLDGVNLLPFIDGSASIPSRTLVVQSHRVEEPVKWKKSSVMTDQWRLVNGSELYDMQQDPGQKQDVAGKHPDVVEQLRQKYEAWWQSCNPQADQYSRIPIGHPRAEFVQLTGHDWHGPNPPWSQAAIAKGQPSNGFWAITVSRPGYYQFLLAKQPLEQPIAINCTEAEVSVGEAAVRVKVSPSARLVPITMQLPTGDFKLSTRLYGPDKGDLDVGAPIVYVSYCGESEPASSELPAWLSAGDRVAWVGGTLIERAQQVGSLEAEFVGRAPLAGLTFCNVGWSGDDVTGRARAVFGAPQDGKPRRLRDIDYVNPSLVVVAYGMSEVLNDAMTPESFQAELAEFVKSQLAAQRRVVLCRIPEIRVGESSPQPSVNWGQVVESYQRRRVAFNTAIANVAGTEAQVIDLPALSTNWFVSALNLSDQGYQEWSQAFAQEQMGDRNSLDALRASHLEAISRKAHHGFFELHRPQNETYLFLFRKHEQGNNGVEPQQNRPLIAAEQLQLLHAAARQTQ